MHTQVRLALETPSAILASQRFVLRHMCDDVGEEVTTDLAFIVTGCPMALRVIRLYLSGFADVTVDNMVLQVSQGYGVMYG